MANTAHTRTHPHTRARTHAMHAYINYVGNFGAHCGFCLHKFRIRLIAYFQAQLPFPLPTVCNSLYIAISRYFFMLACATERKISHSKFWLLHFSMAVATLRERGVSANSDSTRQRQRQRHLAAWSNWATLFFYWAARERKREREEESTSVTVSWVLVYICLHFAWFKFMFFDICFALCYKVSLDRVVLYCGWIHFTARRALKLSWKSFSTLHLSNLFACMRLSGLYMCVYKCVCKDICMYVNL